MRERSNALFQKAKKIIPGGVNSPVRAGKSVGIDPPFIERADKCNLWDADGNKYVDYVCSWGPMIFGHNYKPVVEAIIERASLGTSYGAPTSLEVEMAEVIVEMVPSIEMVRMVNSGTEAAMSAIRLARGYTGREKIVKFEGCYHGHSDSLLVSAGSGVATLGIPGSPGVPSDLAGQTISLAFNDIGQVRQALEKYGDMVAAVIIEPIPGNMGVVVPDQAYLAGLRDLCTQYGVLLIFDEVISGFRAAPGGAQEIFDIMPDLTCLGKIIGGGLPVGAYGGKKEVMQSIAPEGGVYQAGTLSGNPLAMIAGITTLKILQKGKIYEELEEKGRFLFSGLKDAAVSAGLNIQINRIGSLGSLFFNEKEVTDFSTAKKSSSEMFVTFYQKMLEQGIYLAPSPFEAWFISTAHDKDSLTKTIECAENSFKDL